MIAVLENKSDTPLHATEPRFPAPGHDAAVSRSTIIEPASGWQFVKIGELWQYRELLYYLCWRDVKVRYKQTVLGAAWAILQPAMMMAVFTIFFGRLGGMSSGGAPYPLFVLAGLLPWFFFSTAVANAGSSVIGSERLITKIYFPRLVVPFASISAAFVDFLVAIGLLFAALLVYGQAPSWQIVFAPVVVAIMVLTATGLGTLLAALRRCIPRFSLHHPVLDPDRLIRHTDDLHAADRG